MDDFVGPSRFQWPDEDLDIGTRVRALLPARFHVDPHDPENRLDSRLLRPGLRHMFETDPTEAADSERILALVDAMFPAARTILTGGAIYHLKLNDVLSNFEEGDGALLQTLLLLDETLAQQRRTHYAVTIARKS